MANFFQRLSGFFTRKKDDEEEKRRKQSSFLDKLGRGALEVGATIQRRIPKPIQTPENVQKTVGGFGNALNQALEKPLPIPQLANKDKPIPKPSVKDLFLFSGRNVKRTTKALEEVTEPLPASPKRVVRKAAEGFSFGMLSPKLPETKKTKVAGIEFNKEDIIGEIVGFIPGLITGQSEARAVMKAPVVVKLLSKVPSAARPIVSKAIQEGLAFASANAKATPGDLKKRMNAAVEGFVTGAPFGAGAGVPGTILKKAKSVLQIPGTSKFLRLSEEQLGKLKNETANKFVYHLSASPKLLQQGTEITLKELKKEAPKAYNLLKKATPDFLGRLKSARVDTGSLVKRGAVMAGTAGALTAAEQQIEEGKVKPGEAALAGVTTLPFALFGGLKVVGGKKLTGAALEKAEQAASQAKQKLETKFQMAVDSGSEKEVKRLLGQFKEFDTQAGKFGVSARIRPESELRGEVEKATQEAQAELAPKTVTEGLRDKFGAEADTVRKHIQTIKLMGEKTSKKTGELFREHIPRTKGATASDEVASALGMTESEYMQEIVQRAGVVGGGAVEARTPFFKSLRRQAETKVSKMPALRKTPTAVAEGQGILPGTVRPADLKATESQVKDVRILRKRAGVTDEQGKVLVRNLFSKDSYKKLNRQEAEIIKSYLQPKAKARLEPLLTKAKEEVATKRSQIAGKFVTPESVSPLEKEVGAISGLKDIEKDVENLITTTKQTIVPGKKKDSFLSLLTKVPREQTGAKIAGVKDVYFEHVQSLLNTTKVLENRLREGIKGTFKGLSKEETQRVIQKSSGVEVTNLTAKETEAVKYLRQIFDAHLNLANRVRALSGKKVIQSRKNYIPYIISEELSQALGTGRNAKFFLERTKTNQELLSGLFSQNPEYISEIFSRSAARFFKRDLYQSSMKDLAEKVSKMSDSANAFVKEVEQKDIGILPEISTDFGRITFNRVDDVVSKISGKKIPINDDLKKALENTHFADEIKESLDKGYLVIPRFKAPNVGGWALKSIYLMKLGANVLFTAVNMTQNSLAIPFAGTKSLAGGLVDTIRILSPLRTDADRRYLKMWQEIGVFSDVGGEEVVLNKIIDNTLGFNIKASEFFNRVLSASIGKREVGEIIKKTGVEASEKDRARVAAEFAKFINPVQGAGRSPLHARGGTFSKALYMFQQFPMQALDVSHEAVKATFKDSGVKKFWQGMARAGGVSPEVLKSFESLPAESKTKVGRLLVAVAAPVGIIYGLTGTWSVASRYIPGISFVPDFRNPVVDLMLAVNNYVEDPEGGFDTLKKQLADTFSPVQLKRITDAMSLAEKGTIEDVRGRPKYVLKEGQSPLKVALFGRSVISEDEQFKKVRELEKQDKGASEEGYKTAKSIIDDIQSAKSVEDKRAVLKEYADKGLIDESVIDKMKTLLKEKATGKGSLERSVQNLSPTSRAQYVIDEINAAKSVEEKRKILQQMAAQGIITEAVVAEMKTILSQPKKKKSFIDNLRDLPLIP